jgi:hypothetical protein
MDFCFDFIFPYKYDETLFLLVAMTDDLYKNI